jgi:hypothetical protein
MCSDFSPLFEHDDGQIRIDLLQTDRRRQAGGARTDNHNVEFHALAFRQLAGVSHQFSCRTRHLKSQSLRKKVAAADVSAGSHVSWEDKLGLVYRDGGVGF